ncbi:MAG: type II secretion system protein GspG [Bdellovibrionales bacterium CG10_big_fil_rev_8_21_14_0_10_45_34]|nr:MAG: type II secretion system protein GspG [Bdellovibrionales bacterium CG10_big_fil_rev_8_21_14_0_10_45_34]
MKIISFELFSNNLKKISQSHAKGMTLIEIMIVLMILGGILALVGTQVNKNLRKSKISQAKVQMGEIKRALETYYTDCGSFPPSEQGLNALLEAPESCPNWGPEAYTKKQVLDDPWGQRFIYEQDGANFTLRSLGEDKREGGSGYAADISSEDN